MVPSQSNQMSFISNQTGCSQHTAAKRHPHRRDYFWWVSMVSHPGCCLRVALGDQRRRRGQTGASHALSRGAPAPRVSGFGSRVLGSVGLEWAGTVLLPRRHGNHQILQAFSTPQPEKHSMPQAPHPEAQSLVDTVTGTGPKPQELKHDHHHGAASKTTVGEGKFTCMFLMDGACILQSGQTNLACPAAPPARSLMPATPAPTFFVARAFEVPGAAGSGVRHLSGCEERAGLRCMFGCVWVSILALRGPVQGTR